MLFLMLSVVIPVFNKSHLTERCLESVLKNSSILEKVTVIDNASTDDTPQVLAKYAAKFLARGLAFQVIKNELNLGFGRACNQGIRVSAGRYLAIVNNDTWLMPSWDHVLGQELEKKKLDLIGPFFDERPFSDDPAQTAKQYLEKNKEEFRPHFVPILMFFRMTSLHKLKLDHGGIFDERFFVTYEDTDLRKRMDDQKMTYGQTSVCYIWHHSMGTRSTPGLLPEGYEAQGLKLFMEKWGYDPRAAEHTFIEKQKRKYRKWRASRGLF